MIKSLERLIVFVCALLFFGGIGFAVYLAVEHRQLSDFLDKNGTTVDGRIYEKESSINDHVYFHYEFEVDQQDYTGYFVGRVDWIINIGDTIQLRYDPNDPSRNEWIKTTIPQKESSTKSLIISGLFALGACISYVYSRLKGHI